MRRAMEELNDEMRKSLDLMRRLRGEVRVKVHSASTDVRVEWRELEPHLVALERGASRLAGASRDELLEALERLIKLYSSLSEACRDGDAA